MSSVSQSAAVASKRRSGIRQRTSLVCPGAPRPCSGSRTGCILSDPRDGREWTATSAGVMRQTGCHPEQTGSVASTLLPNGCNTHPPACSSSRQTLLPARTAGRPARREASGNSCTCVRRNLSRCTSAMRRMYPYLGIMSSGWPRMHKHARAQNAYAPCASVPGLPEMPPSKDWPGVCQTDRRQIGVVAYILTDTPEGRRGRSPCPLVGPGRPEAGPAADRAVRSSPWHNMRL